MYRHRWLIALAAIATSLVLVSADADARAGRSSSMGSRGSHTFSAPPSTSTSPTAAAPINRTMTQPGAATGGLGNAAAPRPGLLGGGLFGGGLLGGLAAGFIGAGVFGMLFGHGLFGGMAGFASILGLVLQVVLVVIVARLIFAWWQRRQSPQPDYASSNASNANAAPAQNFAGLGGMFGGGGNAGPATAPVTIEKEDYDAFERLLEDVQAAYSNEDLNALRREVTPEMLSYFSEDLSDNASRGVVNRVTDVKLLQGDLSEAWHEGNADYATVAMRFALTDSLVDRNTGKTVEGGSPSEVTELWTFMRSRGGNWLLSAIQQG